MPELPEVETVVRDLAKTVSGLKITGARIFWARTIACPSAEQFKKEIVGRQILRVFRRAKFIGFELSAGYFLFVHLRMTGHIDFCDAKLPAGPHDRVILDFKKQLSLCFRDARKFGRFYLTRTPGKIIGSLGPEPLAKDFTSEIFFKRLSSRRGKLKPLLLDQKFIAGIGNIYADEALYDAGIHPETRAEKIDPKKSGRLYEAILKVLRRGIKNLGTTMGKSDTNFYSVGKRRGRNQDRLRVFRRTGENCGNCGGLIRRIVVAQRSTHFCPHCQKM